MKAGTAVRLAGIDEIYPNFQTAVIFYSEKFAKEQPEQAKKFMRALIHAARDYNDALDHGHLTGPGADDVIKILTEYSFVKDPAVHRAITSQYFDPNGDVKFEYSVEKNSELAKNLKGHLMLTTGDIDDNVHMVNTLRMADALIKANKRFDFFLLPGIRHSYQPEQDYFFWVRSDYFCRWLLGKSADSVDIVELNRESEQVGGKKAGR